MKKWGKKFILFLKETKVEMKRVSWLTKKQSIKYTSYVLVFSFALALYLGLLDYLFFSILLKLKY